MILQEQKVYVTDRLREQAEAVWRCIGENNGHFYVCGDAGKMAKVSSRWSSSENLRESLSVCSTLRVATDERKMRYGKFN